MKKKQNKTDLFATYKPDYSIIEFKLSSKASKAFTGLVVKHRTRHSNFDKNKELIAANPSASRKSTLKYLQHKESKEVMYGFGCGVDDIAGMMMTSPKTFQRGCSELEKEGLLKHIKGGTGVNNFWSLQLTGLKEWFRKALIEQQYLIGERRADTLTKYVKEDFATLNKKYGPVPLDLFQKQYSLGIDDKLQELINDATVKMSEENVSKWLKGRPTVRTDKLTNVQRSKSPTTKDVPKDYNKGSSILSSESKSPVIVSTGVTEDDNEGGHNVLTEHSEPPTKDRETSEEMIEDAQRDMADKAARELASKPKEPYVPKPKQEIKKVAVTSVNQVVKIIHECRTSMYEEYDLARWLQVHYDLIPQFAKIDDCVSWTRKVLSKEHDYSEVIFNNGSKLTEEIQGEARIRKLFEGVPEPTLEER